VSELPQKLGPGELPGLRDRREAFVPDQSAPAGEISAMNCRRFLDRSVATPMMVGVLALGCGKSEQPTPIADDVTKICLELRSQRYVLEKLREEQRSILDGKREASAGQMDLLLLRVKAAEAKIDLAEYKARERGIQPSDCKP
jgi:hypothetical protein